MKNVSARELVTGAMIAALYTALTVALAPISYGMVQIRVAEALTLLPVYSPVAVWGVTLGCLLSNLVGLFTGANLLGGLDLLFGTMATLLAALCSRALRRVTWNGLPVAAAVPPVLFNAVIIGLELTYVTAPGNIHLGVFLLQAGFVALGEAISCFGFGLPLCWCLRKTGLIRQVAR